MQNEHIRKIRGRAGRFLPFLRRLFRVLDGLGRLSYGRAQMIGRKSTQVHYRELRSGSHEFAIQNQ